MNIERSALLFGFTIVAAAAGACSSSTTNPGGVLPDGGGASTNADSSSGADGSAPAQDPKLAGCVADPGPPAFQTFGASDPIGGAAKFTLANALEGFPAQTGKLSAAIVTEKGTILCRLDEEKAPISVANFVGLARGTRPFKDASGSFKTGRFYDGLTWHRVIPDFVIQGGDPKGTGSGGPGYDLPEENHAEQVKGALSMAASDAPSGSQFYIVTGTGPANDYNVFGSCEVDVAIAIAAVETDKNDKPKVPVHMQRIDIARCP